MFNKPNRKVDRVFIHCSASDNPEHDNIETVRSWHLERGFNDVGYHYFIKKDGTVEEGRSLSKIPAAQKGHNRGTIAICVHGLELSKFTLEQMGALWNLCSDINKSYERRVTYHGHCEVSNKTCPVFNYVKALQLDKDGYMPMTYISPSSIRMFKDDPTNPIGKAINRLFKFLLDFFRKD